MNFYSKRKAEPSTSVDISTDVLVDSSSSTSFQSVVGGRREADINVDGEIASAQVQGQQEQHADNIIHDTEEISSSDEEDDGSSFPDVNDRTGDKSPSWTNLPIDVWYKVREIRTVSTHFGKRMLLSLSAPRKPAIDVFATPFVAKEIKKHRYLKKEGRSLYVMPLGLKPSKKKADNMYANFIIKAL